MSTLTITNNATSSNIPERPWYLNRILIALCFLSIILIPLAIRLLKSLSPLAGRATPFEEADFHLPSLGIIKFRITDLHSRIYTHQTPLHRKDDTLRKWRKEARALVKLVKKNYPKLRQFPQVQGLNDFSRCPELAEAYMAIRKRVRPVAVREGCSGTYLIRDREQRPLGIFKPADQEPGRPGNTKRYTKLVHNIGSIEPGTGYQRERMAFLLMPKFVPKTVVAYMPTNRPSYLKGSFQKFISGFVPATKHPVTLPTRPQDIQRLAILDIRTLNADRHLNNFLIHPDGSCVPIDHGLTLPGEASLLRFHWLSFGEAHQPFSPENLQYIKALNPGKDVARIQAKFPQISVESLVRSKLATVLLKKGAAAGLSAAQIGLFMIHGFNYSDRDENRSFFETDICRLYPMACKQLKLNPSATETMETLLSSTIDKYCQFLKSGQRPPDGRIFSYKRDQQHPPTPL